MRESAVSDTRLPSSNLFGGTPRDPGRIKPFLETFAAVWSHPNYSDQRFGQFIKNLSRDPHTGEFQDIWNWENSTWREALDAAWREALGA